MINFQLALSSDEVLAIPQVPSPEACALADSGWYYDDPGDPERLILCPRTCELIEPLEQARAEVLFGCETTVAPGRG